jgi:hypothetical protein
MGSRKKKNIFFLIFKNIIYTLKKLYFSGRSSTLRLNSILYYRIAVIRNSGACRELRGVSKRVSGVWLVYTSGGVLMSISSTKVFVIR